MLVLIVEVFDIDFVVATAEIVVAEVSVAVETAAVEVVVAFLPIIH